ncbi:hypothetical protein PVAP13_7NG330900 [Panicum virgatum]|uniref:Serpin domain-containing protein n=1 Tax=Panicum virgatum TaxID=38727 RepID=A0A8T0Q9Y5_PANVG|nr:hypothetical protein PVAP13_7NG330900 [Panicum virgatum]
MDHCMRVAWFPGMEEIAKQSNFLFSPMSIRAGLALLAAGTHGPTLRQLLTFLGSEDTHHLDEANARLLANFVSSAASAHQAAARSVDFENRPAAALAEVNAFIEQATVGRLRNVLPEDAVDGRTTKVVLANGLHFKATWARRFDPSNTVHRDFLRHDGRPPVWVPFLSAAGRQYAESFDAPGLGFKVLQCFYKMVGRDGRLDFGALCFLMLVFLPHRRDGLADLRLAVTQRNFVMRCVPRREQLVCPCMVPKFKFSFKFDVRNALRQLGLSAPFDKDVSDLSGMVSICKLGFGIRVGRAADVRRGDRRGRHDDSCSDVLRFKPNLQSSEEPPPPPPPPPRR